MGAPVSRQPPSQPLPVPPAIDPARNLQARSAKAHSTRNPFRRIISWAKSTALARAFVRLFSRPARAPAAAAAAGTSLKDRKVTVARSETAPSAGIPRRRHARDALPELPSAAASATAAAGRSNVAAQRRSKLAPQTVLAGALHEIGEWGKQAQLTDAQRDFLAQSWRDLAGLAVRREPASAQEIVNALGNLSLHVNMPEELGEQLRAQYRPFAARNKPAAQTTTQTDAAKTDANNAPHMRFLNQVDGALAMRLAEAPSAEALEASSLVGQHVRRHMQEFYQLGAQGEGAADLTELQNFLQKLAADMTHGRASLLTSLPGSLEDVAAFVRTPDYPHFLAMLDKTDNGYDMMKQAFLLSQTEMAPEQCARHWQSYASKTQLQAAGKPFSFLQQAEFCAQHFQTRLLPPAYDVTDTPGAELASAVFVGERLAQAAGRTDLQGEHFAQGHMLWLALTQKQSLANSLAIMRAVRTDSRPVAAFARDTADNVWRPQATAQGEAVIARQAEILDEPLASHDLLGRAVEDPQLSAALEDGWPAAVATASAQWRG